MDLFLYIYIYMYIYIYVYEHIYTYIHIHRNLEKTRRYPKYADIVHGTPQHHSPLGNVLPL